MILTDLRWNCSSQLQELFLCPLLLTKMYGLKKYGCYTEVQVFARLQFSCWKWWNPGSTDGVIVYHMEMLDTAASNNIGRLGFRSAICLQIVYSWAQAIGQPNENSISRYSRARNFHECGCNWRQPPFRMFYLGPCFSDNLSLSIFHFFYTDLDINKFLSAQLLQWCMHYCKLI